MFAELRLWRRLCRGSRGRDLMRYSAVIVAAALVAVAVSLAVTVSLLGTKQLAVESARFPVRAAGQTGVSLAESTHVLDGRTWTQVVITSTAARIAPPPGLRSWPSPGSSAVSPALADILDDNRHTELSTAIQRRSLIDQAGLTDPRELYSYTVLATSTSIGGSYREIDGFGGGWPSGTPDIGTVAVVCAILAFPVIQFFRSAFGFLLSGRSRRFRLLLRVGIPRSSVARVFAFECALLTGLGIALGLAIGSAVQPTLGASAVLKASWWPDQGSVPGELQVGAILIGVVGAWLLARHTFNTRFGEAGRTTDRVLSKGGRKLARAAVTGTSAYLLGTIGWGLVSPHTHRQAPAVTISVLVAVLVGLVGLIYLTPSLSPVFARRAARNPRFPALRLGVSGAAHFADAGSRLIAALAILSVVSGVASGFIAGVGRWGIGDISSRALEIDNLSSLSEADRARLFTELDLPFVVRSFAFDAGSMIVAADCVGLAAFDQLGGSSATHCREGEVQRGDAFGLDPGLPSEAELDLRGAAADLSAVPLTPGVQWTVRLPASHLLRLSARDDASLILPLVDEARSMAAMTFFMERFPEIPVQAGVKDPESLEIYTRLASALEIAFGAAVALSAAALSFLAMELAWSNARSVSTLAALGVASGALRLSATAQALWPVLVASVGVGFGLLAGTGIRSYFGTVGMIEPEVFATVLVPWVGALILTAAVGAASVSPRFRRGSVSDA